MKSIYLILLFFFNIFSCFTQNDIEPNFTKGIDKVFELNFDQAKKFSLDLKNKNIHQGYYLESLSDAIFLSVNEENIKEYINKQSFRIKNYTKFCPKSSPYYNFILAELYLHYSYFYFKSGQIIFAAQMMRKSYFYLKDNQKLYPNFIPHHSSLGLLHVILGSLPNYLHKFIRISGMNPNLNLGLDQIKKAGIQNDFWGKQAKLTFSLVSYYLLNDKTLLAKIIKENLDEHPDQNLWKMLEIVLSLKAGKGKEALDLIEKQYQGISEFTISGKLRADALLYSGRYSEASTSYQNFITQYKGLNSLKEVYLKLFFCDILNEKNPNQKIYFTKIISLGSENTEADKYAKCFAEKGIAPNIDLLKVRLFTDGGYTKKSDSVLLKLNIGKFSTLINKIEYCYRKARLAHILSDTTTAIMYYQKTIELSPQTNEYFAPNSALQLGYLYFQQNKCDLAEKFFNLATSFQAYEYQRSVEQKAKSALLNLKKNKCNRSILETK